MRPITEHSRSEGQADSGAGTDLDVGAEEFPYGPRAADEHPRRQWIELLSRSMYAKVLVVLALGLMMWVITAALQNTPADGPTAGPEGTLADVVAVAPSLRVDKGTPTSLSSQSVEAPPTTLNPNAIFVSAASGSDDNAGDGFDTALKSLQLALDRVQPGETVYVMDGTYAEVDQPDYAHYMIKAGGTADAWVRVEAAPGHNPVIVASEGNAIEVQADYVEVVGLTMRGEGFGPDNTWGTGVLVRNSHHVMVAGNTVSNFPLNGISSVESSNLAVINNEIFENAFWNDSQGSGISFWKSVTEGEPADADGYHDRIIGNRIYRNENKVKSRWRDYEVITDGNGIIIDGGRDTGYTGRTLIANNVVFDNGGRGIMVYLSDNVDVMYNTTYHNGRTAELDGGPVELVAGRSGNVRFFNNLAWPRPDSQGIRHRSSGTNIETGGNVIVTADGSAGDVGSTDTSVGSNPGLVRPSINEAEADFSLTEASSAIGAGVETSPRLDADITGADRTQLPLTAGAYLVAAPG